MKKITKSSIFLNKKRARKYKRELFFKRLKFFRIKRKSQKKLRASKNRHIKILSLFKTNSKDNILNSGKENLTINLPLQFSVIHDPESFLKTLYSLNLNKIAKLQNITINHTNVKRIDLAAESIFDFIVLELKKIKNKIQIEGYLPEDKSIARYIKATGIIKYLNVTDKLLDDKEEKLHRVFSMRSKRLTQNNSSSKGWKEKAIEDFVKHINECLKDHNQQLTMEAQGLLAKYTGEILNNAEDHSGYDDVFITGYLDNSNKTHWCEIAIFNFGKTIAKTFKDLPKESFTYNEIKDYLKKHISKNLFGRGWTKENLLTIVALQGHISSKNTTKTQDRGQGTVDLIEFFQDMHKQCIENHESSKAEMAILSGSTYIYFDGRYTMQKNSKGRKIIAFNASNDLYEKPDSSYVKDLGHLSFPGTIISIRFPMKHDNESLIGELHE